MGFDKQFTPFKTRMEAEGLPILVIETFRHYYRELLTGATGHIPEDKILPVDSLPDSDTFAEPLINIGKSVLPKTVMIKLNGGLGTSMGMEQAKTLLEVKDGMTFLDIMVQQALHMKIPLVLMNSFVTRADTLSYLRRYPALWEQPIGLDFLQHKVPKILQSDFSPAHWPDDPENEWNPPGHGDIYTALVTSGMLDRLLEHGYEYAFISNGDNLGAVVDLGILGYFSSGGFPFMLEAADRTPVDRKGGHLAQMSNGQLILREIAQTPPEDEEIFQDIGRHKYFNTNNLWVFLPALKHEMEKRANILGLPLIRNAKNVNPRYPDSPKVFQLETAMGSAIAVFDRSQAVRVPRTRFAPVKKTDDLLAVRSDAYVLTEDFRIIQNPERTRPPLVVQLDPRYYQLVDEMEARFPYNVPSLLACDTFQVEGNVVFGDRIEAHGNVLVRNPSEQQAKLPDDMVLSGSVVLSND